MQYSSKRAVKSSIIYFVMIVLTLVAVVPIWIMLINATRSTEEINAGLALVPTGHAWQQTVYNLHTLTNRGFKIWRGFLNSAIISFGTTILCVYFSTLTAYGIYVYHFKGKKFLWGLVMFLIMLPGTLSFIGFYQFMALLGLTGNWKGFIPLTIPSIASAATVMFIHQYMESILSLELIEAARIDGAGEFFTFNRIVLPIMQPAMATQAIFAFVGSWNNFMTPSVIITNEDYATLPMLVQKLRGDIYRTEFGGIYLGIAISLIPIIIFYAIMSRYIIAGITMGSVKE
ncbi:MAG: carbohydrate ABC transporter permease [Treponema sp.]|jgi:multiple sugar transport system permease protein|nr:carbohydrate ABC transporter permease [Treponema sp.]